MWESKTRVDIAVPWLCVTTGMVAQVDSITYTSRGAHAVRIADRLCEVIFGFDL